jgi:hypothetical protein
VTIVALHPEDLLEREARGELSSVEADRLAMHLRHCAVCRLERTLRADFRQDDEELRVPALDVHSLLSRALAPGAGSSGSRREVERARISARRRIRPMLFAAAALFVAGASVAAGWTGLPRLRAQSGTQEVHWEIPRRSRDEPRVARTPSAATVGSLRAAPPSESASLFAPSMNPQAVTATSKFSSSSNGSSSKSPASDVAALFAQANAVRRSGDRVAAAELYRALVERYPHSAEAHEAHAAMGHLLLSDGNAAAALRCFDEYLFTSGPLEEDVRVDRAQALDRLHRYGDEAEAWSALLRAHPGSVHADRARMRLRELGDR